MPLNLVEIKSSRKIPNAPSLQGQGYLKRFQTLQLKILKFFSSTVLGWGLELMNKL